MFHSVADDVGRATMQQEWAYKAAVSEKVYHPHWRAILPQFVCYALLMSCSLWFFDHVPLLGNSESHSVLHYVFSGLFYALYMSIFSWAIPSLSVSPTGLVCRSWRGYTLYATWTDIAGIGARPRRWLFIGRDGLYLHRGYWQPFWNTRKRAERGPMIPFIPLSYFDPQWRNHEIGQTLRQHAPWLFTDVATRNGTLPRLSNH